MMKPALRTVRSTLPSLALAAAAMAQPASKPAISPADAAALARALAACDQGAGASVKSELERLAARYPGNFAANEALGLVYMEAADFPHALPYLTHAAAARTSNAAAQANLGAALLATNDAAAAERILRRAVALDPNNAAAQASLGKALYAERKPGPAAEAFAAAAALDPADPDNAYNAALALYDLHRDAAAAQALQSIPQTRRTDAVESLWGDLAERQGRYQDAVEHLQRAAALNPTEDTVYAVAVELLRHWSWDAAAEMTAFGTRQYPASRRMRMADGIAAYGAGRYAAAAAIFGALLALDAGNATYGGLLGLSCAAAGGAAAPECASLVAFAEAHPGNAQIDISAAVSLLHQPSPDRYLDQAERLLTRAIAHDRTSAEAYYQLGVLQQQRQQWAASVASLTRAVELRPAFAEAHYRLSRAFAHTGDPDGARREIALQQQYSRQEKDDSTAKLKEITTFLIASH